MQFAFGGHIVVLINEHTASDGEAFAEGFRRLGLGKLIGRRTWGGEIWFNSSNVLVDRGIATGDPPLRVAQASGTLPLPPRLMAALLATPSPGQTAPPSPPDQASDRTEATPPAEAAKLLEKAGANEIPLVAGWNLISIPLEPPDRL